MRAGALALPLAANATRREILRTVIETPVSAGPGLQYQIGAPGWDGLRVSSVAERWLQAASGGPLPLEDDDEEGPVKALVDGWVPGIVHALARGPLTMDALELAVGLRRRVLRQRVTAMREAGLLEPQPGEGGEARYAVTDWLRATVAPLAAAARNELRHPQPGAVPIEALDVEAAFRLALPLLELPKDLDGTCRLTVELEGEPAAAGMTARVESSRAAALGPAEAPDEAEAWASGSAEAWLDTAIEPDARSVKTGGDKRLARLLLDAAHEQLFAVEQ